MFDVPLVLQTAASLVAILALAGLARWMKLGDAPLLADEDAVRRAAGEVADGFEPVAFGIARDRTAALARDAHGSIMVIKRHGNRFAGRVLGTGAHARLRLDLAITGLEVACGEPGFGRVLIDLPEPQAWADAINGLNRLHHA